MLTEAEIIQRTNKVLTEYFEIEPERLVPTAHIFQDFGLDSLDTVDLIVALQKEFDVTIRDDERIRQLGTLQSIYSFIVAVQKEMSASTTSTTL
jgi:acyl carrier protein